tara:strand:- start:154 stop:360 length:207 start_codon:yes stop_codon:yes gene_type:complete
VRHKSIEIGPITALGITVLSLSNISRFYNAGFLLALFCLSSEAFARQPAMATSNGKRAGPLEHPVYRR